MEATALSVGKTVLNGALGYAKSIVAEEIALQLGIERDVSFITDELEMMQSFLMAADDEQDKHKVLLTWVKQVREVAYNVEDSLMDFSVHYSQRPRCWWCIPGTLWERHDIAKEVKELRTKVEDVSKRNLRYRLIKGSGSKPTVAAEEQANIATVAMLGINEATRTAIMHENSVVDLRQLITNEDKDRSVIGVWGATSDIRTTAIQDVYDDSAVRANFGFLAWVKLVRPFSPKEFIQSLVRQYYENFPEVIEATHKRKTIGVSVFMKMESMSQSEMLDVLDKEVSANSYLIILEDLFSKEWDCKKNYFPDNKKGSRVIVSTEHVEIAGLCMEKPHQVSELKQFSSNQNIYLIHKKVMPSSDSTNENSAICGSEIQEEAMHSKDEDGDNVFDLTSGKKQFYRSRTLIMLDEVFLGRNTEKSKVIELVGQPEDGQGCKVISVWGMGGLGKTTLVQSVYKSPQFDNWKRAWATALRPFNPEQLIKTLAGHLGVARSMELKELSDNLIQILKNHKCLLILDDISSTKEWDLIKSCLKNATRIIVTTREKGIAKHCSGEENDIFNLSGLEEGIALELFKKKVFKNYDEKIKLFPDMNEQARLILKKCDGLPLAISTIGGYLATKPKTITEWKKTYDRINTELEINPELRTIKTVLVRSYDGLPYHLKSCFLYLSVFPEDHKIKRKWIIRRWVAEGYAREMHGMTADEVGDMYFDELLDRSMILPGEEVNIYSGKIESCLLHDIMRQICISKAREENIAFTLEEGCGLSSTHGAIRHLAISSNWKREENLFHRILDLSHVRSLTVFGEGRSFLFSKNMRFLRVLDLQNKNSYEIEERDLNQIGELIHLKFLSLRGCKGFCYLKNCLGKLSSLQTLDIRGTSVNCLPPNITKLQNLQFLRANIVIVPRGIGRLKDLHTFTIVDVHYNGQHCIKELTHLYQLHKLVITGVTETNNKEFWLAIARLNHLRSLSVNWEHLQLHPDNFDCSLGGSLLPPKSIESLKLGSRLVRFTGWIHQLQNLSRLVLRQTELLKHDVEAIGNLPNLAILDLFYGSFKGGELVFKQESFPSLVVLKFGDLFDVRIVMCQDGAMPKLELLEIVIWGGLQEVSGLTSLTKLKEIRLENGGFFKELVDNVHEQLASHSNSIRVQHF